jgi:hypothetical protein
VTNSVTAGRGAQGLVDGGRERRVGGLDVTGDPATADITGHRRSWPHTERGLAAVLWHIMRMGPPLLNVNT